ncbi:MAG: RNA-binding protein [Leptolyngbyaceae cyanobacterium MO_188.B28]|nr:RNA-binding protein [Leptolyngbyaceae cyanobacterium MO_188.B28]
MSVRLYVGNLPKELERQELESVFAECAEDLVSVKLISDRKTGKCRGFGFVTVKTDEQADAIVEKFNGYMLQESSLKVEKALPRSKSKAGDGASSSEGSDSPSNSNASSSRRKGNRNRRGGGSTPVETEAAQPDPRWAQELEKLKELLAAQTTTTS